MLRPKPDQLLYPLLQRFCRVVYLLYSTHPLLWVCVCVSVRHTCPSTHFSPSASRDITENIDTLYVLGRYRRQPRAPAYTLVS